MFEDLPPQSQLRYACALKREAVLAQSANDCCYRDTNEIHGMFKTAMDSMQKSFGTAEAMRIAVLEINRIRDLSREIISGQISDFEMLCASPATGVEINMTLPGIYLLRRGVGKLDELDPERKVHYTAGVNFLLEQLKEGDILPSRLHLEEARKLMDERMEG